MLHFWIFCVFIGEGWDTLAKKAVYTPWKESYGRVRNFDHKNVITMVEGSTLLNILRNHL